MDLLSHITAFEFPVGLLLFATGVGVGYLLAFAPKIISRNDRRQ